MAELVPTDAVSSVSDEFRDLYLDNTVRPAYSPPDFVDGYENPMAWHKKIGVYSDGKSDVQFNCMTKIERDLNTVEHDSEQPENFKWRLFGYNLVICYEYISRRNLDKALKVIGDIENILSSIGSNDPFLKSILIALNHITFSLKGYVMKLCAMDTTVNLENIVMPKDMNHINNAGLCGVQVLFLFEYGVTYADIIKDNALKALSLNNGEAEWHYLMSRALAIVYWRRPNGHYFNCSDEELKTAQTAVNMSEKYHYKIQLIQIYYRMIRNYKRPTTIGKELLDTVLQIISKVMNNTTGLYSLEHFLYILTEINRYENHASDDLEKLIIKLSSSDNGYVHSAIGRYYLKNKKDYEKANFHFKKALDVKTYSSFMNYIYTFYKMNIETAPVEDMLVDMLNTFTHPIHRERIISKIVSYLIITKNDLIQALKYVPMLLSITHLPCIYSLQAHKIKFGQSSERINLIDVIAEKLDITLKNSTISTDHLNTVGEVIQMIKSYKIISSNMIKKNQDILAKKTKENWKTLKPDPNPRVSSVFH